MTLKIKVMNVGCYQQPDITINSDVSEKILCISEGGSLNPFDGEYELEEDEL